MQRKLAAILAADVVGYSRLMEVDEAGTLTRLRTARENLIDPAINAHRGRIVKLMGDGTLAEFASVVDAVACAIEIQRAMAMRTAELLPERRLELRIGVNLGDVIVEGEDIYGEGVNVAARVQALAKPGGILISGTAFDHVERKLDCGFEFLGEQQVKNIEKPIRLYRVLLDAIPSPSAIPKQGSRRPAWRWPAIAAALLTLIGAGAAVWYGLGSNPPIEVASVERMALPLPDKPSIAVLPFTNISDDAGQAHFADGMTDDLITDLSKVSGLFVIARNSTFTYRGKPVKISQVAEELGVRYVLEGSVRRAGDQVRVNAQLIDALTGGHVWADRFDGSAADIFAVQDAFVAKIVEALEVNLTSNEKTEIARTKTDSVAAKEAFEEGWSAYLRYNAEGNLAAIRALKKAIELDPEYGRAYAALALVYLRVYDYDAAWLQKNLGLSDHSVYDQALSYVETAKKYPTALGFTAQAFYNIHRGLSEEARRAAGRAISLDPNDPEAHIAMAWALTISGQPKEALDFVAAAMRLNPNTPTHYVLAHGVALFAVNDLERAAEVFNEGIKQNPPAVVLLPPLAATLASLGRRKEANEVIQRWRPGTGQRTLEGILERYIFPVKWENEHQKVRERLYDGMRIATLPLDITVPSLLTELKGTNVFTRLAAARRLGWFGPQAQEAVPALIDALKDEYVRKDVVQTLGKIGPGAKAAIPALTELQNETLIGIYAKIAIKQIRGN